ncbi:unnamed protein product, partial [Tenebrio molitor]
MEYSTKQPFEDDPIWLIRFFAFDIANLKFTRVMFLMTLILHLVVTLIEIYFSFFVLNLRDNILYGPFFFGMFYGILNLVVLLKENELVD